MPGYGTPPKKNRSRRGTPTRGEWQKLEPLKEVILPPLSDLELPENCVDGWPSTAVKYWESWRIAPVTALWTPDDIALAIDTITHYAKSWMFTKKDGGVPLSAGELRLRMESLGLSAEGRVKRRYLMPDENFDDEHKADLISIQGGKSPDSEDDSIPDAI